MPAPERRRRADLVATAVITAAVVAAAVLVWWTSPERATESSPATGEPPAPAAASSPPDAMVEAWRRPDGAAAMPLAVGGTVITADGGTVRGRDYRSGAVRWTYARDLPLCAATAAFGDAVAVFRTGNGCSEITAVDAATGRRGPQRSGNFDDTMELQVGADYITALGSTRLESWRSDLVRTLEYGRVDAPVQPDSQPRSGCTFESAAASTVQVAVLERCPGDDGVRLTILDPAPDDPSQPDVLGSQALGIDGTPIEHARVVATSGQRTAVVAPDPPGGSGGETDREAALLIYDPTVARTHMTGLPPWSADAVVGVRTGPVITLWTGAGPHARTVALDAETLTVRWELPGTLGPATMMGSDLLVPTPGGLDVVGAWDGLAGRTVGVHRDDGARGPVIPAAVGETVLEQRGSELVALAAEQPERPEHAGGPGQE